VTCRRQANESVALNRPSVSQETLEKRLIQWFIILMGAADTIGLAGPHPDHHCPNQSAAFG
jgi:hypothetical protein